MKYLFLTVLVILTACEQTKKDAKTSNKKDKIEFVKTENTADKTVKFLWRDGESNMIINEEYCKTISDPEKAALGFIATNIGNDCSWDGDYTENERNLKCKIITALDLGYQCSEKHLGFLRQWFKNDAQSLKELESCSHIPDTASMQNTFDEITLTTKENKISVSFKANGVDLRENKIWTWSETYDFEFNNNSIKIIKKDRSKVKVETLEGGMKG
jgi:hypothetical protein